MTKRTEHEFIDFLLPFLATAGDYTREIQRRVRAQPSKGGDNPFQQALTDADLSVQAFLEVALLSRFPQWSFFSEEQEQSLNHKYFARDAAWEVLLDPVDGTRAYLDGADRYQIIVTLRDRSSIAAVACYLPRMERCYVGLRGGGAPVYARAEMRTGASPSGRITLNPGSRRILLFNAPDVRRRLAGSFDVIDIFEEYGKSGVHHGFTELFEGRAAACFHPNPQMIDAAAIAFVIREAGGILTDLKGGTPDFTRPAGERLPGLLASAAPEFHEEVRRALA